MRLRDRLRANGWVFVVVAVLGFVAWDGLRGSSHILQMSATYGVAVDAPAVDPASPTGYASGRRSIVLPRSAADTAHWIVQTQEMIAKGAWRLRHVDYDDAPTGREVHWAGPFHWWLALLAWIDHVASGRPIGISVERSTLLSGPVMLAVLMVAVWPLLARRFSAAAAAVLAVGAVATYPFYIDFLPGRADHHGIANICGLLTVLFLAVASRRTTGEADAAEAGERLSSRRWFAASAVAGGVGLWISAATQVPVLLGIGLGVIAAAWLGRSARTEVSWLRDPGLFRLWGLVGGGMSVAAYLIEYFPNHFGWRLEVNHPLYALAWIGGGELLRALVRGMTEGWRGWSRREWTLSALSAGAVAALPLTIAFTAAETFTVADPFVWRIHASYISEFQGLLKTLARSHWDWSSIVLCLPALVLIPGLVRALRRQTPPHERAELMLASVPALLGWVMGWMQIRWLGLAFALSVPAVAAFLRSEERRRTVRKRFSPVAAWSVAGALVFLPGALLAVKRAWRSVEFTTEEVRSLVVRDVAHALRLRGADQRIVVAGAPGPTSKMIMFGGLSGLGTLYWENADGLRNAAELFAAPSAEAAREMVRRLGVTHIAYFSWDPFAVRLAMLWRGLPEEASIPKDAFIVKLLAAPVPPVWLREIPFQLPDVPALEGEQVRVWQVVEEQQPAEALASAANTQLEMGRVDRAERLLPLLDHYEDDLAATVMRAAIVSRTKDAAGFSAAFDRVLALLPQAAGLGLADHVHLVVVLTVGGRMELAREQLRACVRKADEAGLRALTSGTLADLLALCDGLQIELSTPDLRALAERLLPPDRRR